MTTSDYHRLNPLLRQGARPSRCSPPRSLLAYLVIRDQPRVAHEIRTIGPFAYPLAVAIFVARRVRAVLGDRCPGHHERRDLRSGQRHARRRRSASSGPRCSDIGSTATRPDSVRLARVSASPAAVGQALSGRFAGVLARRARHSRIRRNGRHRVALPPFACRFGCTSGRCARSRSRSARC